jgi:ABC-2 type transport system permease protein
VAVAVGGLRIALATWAAMGKQRVMSTGTFAYILVWVSFPLFNLGINALIYHDDPALRNYAIIGGVIAAFLFGMLFNAGQILDEERYRGTLGNLFLAPCPRYAWLGGMQVVALVEAVVVGAVSLLAGWLIFDLTFDVDLPALVVSIVLFLPCLWAFSMVHGAIGVAVRGANSLSNLISPLVILLAGVMFPVSLMPDWLRYPARLLPFGYGIEAIYASSVRGAGITDLWRSLLPLSAFAVTLPLLGIAAFTWLERLARRRGVLELA